MLVDEIKDLNEIKTSVEVIKTIQKTHEKKLDRNDIKLDRLNTNLDLSLSNINSKIDLSLSNINKKLDMSLNRFTLKLDKAIDSKLGWKEFAFIVMIILMMAGSTATILYNNIKDQIDMYHIESEETIDAKNMDTKIVSELKKEKLL